MTDLELKSIYQSNYLHLLSLLKEEDRDSEGYKSCVRLLERYRDYVRRVAQLDDLPEVPKE